MQTDAPTLWARGGMFITFEDGEGDVVAAESLREREPGDASTYLGGR